MTAGKNAASDSNPLQETAFSHEKLLKLLVNSITDYAIITLDA
jgi:hypothetical protein